MDKKKVIVISIGIIFLILSAIVLYPTLYHVWAKTPLYHIWEKIFVVNYPGKSLLQSPRIEVPVIEIRPGKVLDVPIKVHISSKVPDSIGLHLKIPESGEEIPAGFVFAIVDEVEFERHHNYTLRLRVGVDRSVPPGKYPFKIDKIGNVISFWPNRFLVKVLPP